ncbi:hypothetical protein C8J57DRAFT_1262251 [Mycena rebaudengoi]|nr:hypothetical protein C8J57DRAFT_1262251 [Mycena rebaudengoi]
MQHPTAPSPSTEFEAFTAKVASISKLAVELTKMAIDVQKLPAIVAAQVEAAARAVLPDTLWVRGTPLTPDELEAKFPPGNGDHQTWYVVIRGRNPGLYPSSNDCDVQVRGVPNEFRQKKTGRVEALAFYHQHYLRDEVEMWNDAESSK